MAKGSPKTLQALNCTVCGNPFLARTGSKFCSTKCGHSKHYSDNMLSYEWRLSRLLGMAKNRAATKQLPFNLTLEHLLELWKDTSGCCVICGIPLELSRNEKGKVHPHAPSIDRIIPELGYTVGNIRIVAYQINVALSEFGLEQFDNLVKVYVQYNAQI